MAKSKPQFTRDAAWFSIRRATNRKAATYRCPFCGNYLLATTEHVLVIPDGDPSRRRHAHTACAAAARRAGRLPTRREWAQTQPAKPTPWRRFVAGFKSRPGKR